MMEFNVFEGSYARPIPSGVVRGELEMSSGDAQVISSQKGWQITPVGGREFNSRKAPFKAKVYRNEEAMLDDGSAESATKNVIGDFLDRCIDRNPNVFCTLEEGHRSTSFAHLANIAYKLGKRLEWDAEREVFTNCNEANELLHYKYRDGYALG
jgi:hypothetical protein